MEDIMYTARDFRIGDRVIAMVEKRGGAYEPHSYTPKFSELEVVEIHQHSIFCGFDGVPFKFDEVKKVEDLDQATLALLRS
jgi:hypothetical protein